MKVPVDFININAIRTVYSIHCTDQHAEHGYSLLSHIIIHTDSLSLDESSENHRKTIDTGRSEPIAAE
jgi:hypothetical protein